MRPAIGRLQDQPGEIEGRRHAGPGVGGQRLRAQLVARERVSSQVCDKRKRDRPPPVVTAVHETGADDALVLVEIELEVVRLPQVAQRLENRFVETGRRHRRAQIAKGAERERLQAVARVVHGTGHNVAKPLEAVHQAVADRLMKATVDDRSLAPDQLAEVASLPGKNAGPRLLHELFETIQALDDLRERRDVRLQLTLALGQCDRHLKPSPRRERDTLAS